MQTLLQDLKFAFRQLLKNPGFTAVAVLTLALGIGATTAIFSVADAVAIRSLPFDQPDQLVALGECRPTDPQALSRIQPQNYSDWATQQQAFEAIAAMVGDEFTIQAPGAEPENLPALRVTAGIFEVLRVRPAVGRAFTAENEIEGHHRVAVISDALWWRRFGGNREIVGRTISIQGGSYEVLGVMPPGVTYPVGTAPQTDLWIPYVVPPNQRLREGRNRSQYLLSIARLKPDVSIEQAQAQMNHVAEVLEETHPEWNKDSMIGVRPLRDHVLGASTKTWMWMLLSAVAIVLLIACANVANLVLTRGCARQREVGIRAALGAGRWRLMRQLIIESLVLSATGTVLAILLAYWAIPVLRSSIPEGVPRVAAIALDLRVFGVAAGLALLTGLLFGIFPALQLSKPDLNHWLKEGSGGAGASRGSQRMLRAFVVAEVALAMVLLVGAALFIGSFISLMRMDPGFNPEGVLTAEIKPASEPGQSPRDATAAFAQIVELIGQAPGVVHAGMITGGMPLGLYKRTKRLTVPGRTIEKDDDISIRDVSPEYFKALRIPLKHGRFFEEADRPGNANVVIINESAAKEYFPGEAPLGRSLVIDKVERTIVGVVGDVHQNSLEIGGRDELYVPMAQSQNRSGELIIRTSVHPLTVLPAVKSAVLKVLPDVPLRNVRMMEQVISRQVAQRRLNMLLLGLFGLLGLVISAVGIYGVMAYAVSQRTREIGIRMALGATQTNVLRMVVFNACVLVAAGLAIGGVGAWYLGAAAKPFLFGVEATDPRAFFVALASLTLAALVASIVPARRAANVDPMEALRHE